MGKKKNNTEELWEKASHALMEYITEHAQAVGFAQIEAAKKAKEHYYEAVRVSSQG